MLRSCESERSESNVKFNRYAIGALVATTALLVGGGAALAGNGKGGEGKRQERCEAKLAKIAEKKGVSVEQLQADAKTKLLAAIDAAEQAGKITGAQAEMKRQAVSEASLCKLGYGKKAAMLKKAMKGKRARKGMLGAAAAFLGLDRAALKEQLPGNSLAGLTQQQGKSVDALKAAMVAPAKQRLEKAVANGKITQARADAAFAKLQQQAAKLAEKVFPSK
jgi:hypothetical protein